MQPKKRPEPRGALPCVTGHKHDRSQHQPVGMQAMGPALYEQLRRALMELGVATRH